MKKWIVGLLVLVGFLSLVSPAAQAQGELYVYCSGVGFNSDGAGNEWWEEGNATWTAVAYPSYYNSNSYKWEPDSANRVYLNASSGCAVLYDTRTNSSPGGTLSHFLLLLETSHNWHPTPGPSPLQNFMVGITFWRSVSSQWVTTVLEPNYDHKWSIWRIDYNWETGGSQAASVSCVTWSSWGSPGSIYDYEDELQ